MTLCERVAGKDGVWLCDDVMLVDREPVGLGDRVAEAVAAIEGLPDVLLVVSPDCVVVRDALGEGDPLYVAANEHVSVALGLGSTDTVWEALGVVIDVADCDRVPEALSAEAPLLLCDCVELNDTDCDGVADVLGVAMELEVRVAESEAVNVMDTDSDAGIERLAVELPLAVRDGVVVGLTDCDGDPDALDVALVLLVWAGV